MNLGWSSEEQGFKDEVRAFLAAELTAEMKAATALLTSVYAPPALSLAWQRILNRRGWAAPGWPAEHGGCGWSGAMRYIFATELAEAGAPPLSPMGLGMLGPVLIAHGSAPQKERFLPRILSGEDFWCQGYSEPGSGSDLASLRMQAVDDGDDLICTGQKIWTTQAHAANWIFCLVRTSSEGPAQRGITFLLIDMTRPGIEVRPIISLTGEHVLNEIFFQEVRVPKGNAVGAIGDGWNVAKHLMEFERGGRVAAPGQRKRLAKIKAHAGHDPYLLRQAAEAEIRIDCLEAMELMTMARGGKLGVDASFLKIQSTETSQRLTELALDLAGDRAAPFQPFATVAGGPVLDPAEGLADEPVNEAWLWPVAAKYFNDRAGSIYGGTNEIQRNIIAKALIGR